MAVAGARVRWGILSTARINAKFLAGVRQSETCEVVAVASRDLDRARAYAREQGIEHAHGSYEELLADPGVDVVYISLPNALHLEWTARALAAGKHVLCEKPLGRRVAEVQDAFDTADAAGRVLSEAFMWRHHPQTARMVQLVRDGAIGELRLIRGAFSFPLGADDTANVRLSAALEGGALMDVGCYCVSAARLLAGEPEAVSGQQLLRDGVDIAFAGAMRFPGGVLAHFDAGITLAARDELEVVGDQGSLFLDDPWHCLEPVIELRRTDGVQRIAVNAVNPYRLEAEDVAAAVRGERQPLLGRADAVGQARVIEALYDSAAAQEEGRLNRDVERRLASNEGVFREVNEGISRGQWPGDPSRPVAFRCECARLGCNVLLPLTLADYQEVRSNPRRFFMVAGHEMPEVERVVSSHGQYVVVEKIGEGAVEAERSDPGGG